MSSSNNEPEVIMVESMTLQQEELGTSSIRYEKWQKPLKVISRQRHWKNHFVLSFTFLLCFTAFGSIQNIQSSINSEKALGLLSLSLVYGCMIFSGLLAPAVVKYFGTKWTIVFCTLCYSIYSYGNIFPSYGTIIPVSCLLGLSASPLWVAAARYLTRSAYELAKITGLKPELVINRLNGIFYAIFNVYNILGNAAIYLIIVPNDVKPSEISSCGPNNCGSSVGNEASQPSKTLTRLMFSMFAVIGMVAVILAMYFLDDQRVSKNDVVTTSSSCFVNMSTLKLMGTVEMMLLIPILIYSGLQMGFIFGDFTKAYVTCTQGAGDVGIVMCAFGISAILANILFGQLQKVTSRVFRFSVAFVVHLGLMTYLFVWKPESAQLWQLTLISCVWGTGHAVWQTQLPSILGVIFPKCQEPAFAIWKMCEALGFCVIFVLSMLDYICVYHKLIGLGIYLIVSVLLYYLCEHRLEKQTKHISYELRPQDSCD